MFKALLLCLAIGLGPASAAHAASVLEAGEFQELAGEGMLVAAPHGGFDRYSEDVARQIALVTGAGYLIATGYRTFDHPWNVNRPTSGARLAPSAEATPEAAKAVYAEYRRRVVAAAPRLYVEIHGNSRAESAGAIEVATQGLSRDEARRFKAAFLARVAGMDAAVPHLGAKVEPLDRVHYAASAAKRRGIFTEVPRVVHIEMPWRVRGDERARSAYAWALAFALLELFPPRFPHEPQAPGEG